MKLQTKIMGGFAAIAAIGLLLGIISLVSTQWIAHLSNQQERIRQAYADSADVLSAHYEWRQALTTAVSFESAFTGSTDPTACALGKWLQSDSSKTDDPELLRLFAAVAQPHEAIHHGAEEINALLAEGRQQEAIQVFRDRILPLTNETIGLIGQIEQHYADLLMEKTADIDAVQTVVTWLSIALLLGAIAASVLLSLRLTKSIMKPIRHITKSAETVASGVLDIQIDYDMEDEIGQLGRSFLRLTETMKEQSAVLGALAGGDYTVSIPVRREEDAVNQAINHMIDNTNEVMGVINIAAEQVSTGAQQVADGAQALASGSTEQAATVQQLSDSIAEVAGQAEENSAQVKDTTEQLGQASARLSAGNQQMRQLTEAMSDIRSASDQIASITKVIEDIAFQTNILALNAAIEAARAGSAGKGFAVVADEVRNLAAKSAEAAHQTGDLINTSVATVEKGTQITAQTAQILQDAESATTQVMASIAHIEQVSAQQALALEQVKEGLTQVSAVVQNNAATAEENSATSEEMSAQAATLRHAVTKFRLKDTDRGLYGFHTFPAPIPAGASRFSLESSNDFDKY